MKCILVCALLLTPTASALACGPFFPETIIANDHRVLEAPPGDFGRELQRFLPPESLHAVLGPEQWPGVPAGQPVSHPQNRDDRDGQTQMKDQEAAETADADLADLRAAGVSADVQAAYAQVRNALEGAAVLASTAAEHHRTPTPWADAPVLPANLPAEFALYAQGAIAFRQNQIAAAQDAWAKVLSLPAAQRKFRSTWAAFMLGKTYLTTQPQIAIGWMQKVRQLAASGFSDRLGLAAASYGWEAKVTPDAVAALHLYLRQAATGDPTAIMSLRETAAALLEKPEEIQAAAADPAAREVLAAYFVASGPDWLERAPSPRNQQHAAAWLAAVQKAGVHEVDAADLLGWAAYNLGDYALAQQWIDLAPAHSPMAHWIRAKLLARAGDVPGSIAQLALAAHGFPQVDDPITPPGGMDQVDSRTQRARLEGEWGTLALDRAHYTEALTHLINGGYWTDAAYVAEHVLTADELKAYVDQHPDLTPTTYTADTTTNDKPPMTESRTISIRQLADLLARRLVRLGRWREARRYFAADTQPKLDAYVAAIRKGDDASLTAAARSDALFDAARIARRDGMELMGTELDPDGSIWSGNYPVAEVDRTSQTAKLSIPASGNEKQRVANLTAETPSHRWHYRYVALEHAWAAIALMPDESDATAARIIEAAGWLRGIDDPAVNRFYHALVTRCGTTADGRYAQEHHWFPPAEKPNN